MKILAVDTATKSCSVAIVQKETILAEVTLVSEQTHSKHLMEVIKNASLLSGIAISDLAQKSNSSPANNTMTFRR